MARLDELRKQLDAQTLTTDNEEAQRLFRQAYASELGESEDTLRALSIRIGEWRERKQFVTSWYNVPEKLMLIVTELAEAMEAYRHLPEDVLRWLAVGGSEPPAQDKWLEHEENFEVELADTMIRMLDLCGALRIPIAGRICEKMAKNELRPVKHGKER